MFPKITRLQNRFFICYLLAVFIPITFLSSMIYNYHSRQRIRDYVNERKNTLLIEQNFLENQLSSSRNYFNQLKSNYELELLLRGFYCSEREIVYSYKSQIYSLLSGITLYDPNLKDIIIYVDNDDVARILHYFEPMADCGISQDQLPSLIDGLWQADEEEGSFSFSFYIGFSNPPMTVFPGIARIQYNTGIFDSYAESDPNTSIYFYLNGSQVYSRNDTEEASACLKRYEKQLLTSTVPDQPQVIPNAADGFLVSSISLDGDVFDVIKVTPQKGSLFSYIPFLLSLLISILVLMCASIILFLLIFRPLNNVIRLSEHMNRQNNHTLTPYEGKVSKDETGDLILAFNRMVERINDLSSSLLRNEIQLKNAQLEALQAQLNPHFFYGTLESIRMIAEASHQKLISEITYAFGNLMRYCLSREYLVPVSREIEMTRQYISIQEKRLAGRFDISWEVCELDEKWRCPKFILYSLVENAFTHNVSKCRQFIHIYISLKLDGEDLTITVSNTGPGIAPDRLQMLRRLMEHPEERGDMTSESNGRSIFNISDRLKLFYGEDYRLTMESEENKFTTCSVRIHKRFINF